MTCNGTCVKYKATRPHGFAGRYATGQKRCSVCVIWIKWDGASCPCCNFTLRTKPRNTNNRIELQKVTLVRRI